MRNMMVFLGEAVVKYCSLFCLLTLVACGSLKHIATIDNSCESYETIEGASNVSLFLNVVHLQGNEFNLKVKINSIELLVDDLWIPVASNASEVHSLDSISVQYFLARQWLKGRFCRGIRVNVNGATLSHDNVDRVLPIINSTVEVMLQNPLPLDADTRKILLLEWDPEKSLSAAGFESLSLSVFTGGVDRITSNLIYVACPDIDTVYVVRTDKFQVVDAFPVKGRPTYLAVSLDSKKIYVLASSLSKIIPFDIYTHLPANEILVPLANSPIFMTVNNNSKNAYVLDDQGVLTSIDLASGNMLQRNRIGSRPNYLYYISAIDKLAISSTFDQSVYLVNSVNLVVEDSVSLGSTPLGLGSLGNYLYIAESSSNTVSVYDLVSRKILSNIHVGFEPARFVTNDNSVYVTNYRDGAIAVVQGGQFSVSKEISIGKSARELAVSTKQSLLFVGEGDCDEGSLVIIDTTGNRIIGRVQLGAKPIGLAVID